MPYIVLTPNQFEVLEAAASKSDEIKSFQETGANTGVITTKDVVIDFNYDPLRQILNFNIGKKNSLAAKIAGDNVISNHITALIHELEYPQTVPKEPVPSVEPAAVELPAATESVPALVPNVPNIVVKPIQSQS